MAYGIHDMGIYQGPLPTSIDNEGNHFEVTYDNGNADLNIKDNSFNIGFDVSYNLNCMNNTRHFILLV